MNWFAHSRHLVPACAAAILLTSCGETNQKLIDRYRPQVDEFRATLKKVSDILPEVVEVPIPPSQPIDPPVEFQLGSDAPTNTDFLMFRNLLDPYFDYDDNNLMSLGLSDHLQYVLEWSGPENPMAESALKKRARKNTDSEWAASLATRYLAVAKIAEYQPVIATGSQQYTQGYIKVHGHLVDLEKMEVLLSFPVEATTIESVSFEYDQNRENPEERMVAHARSSMWSAIRKQYVEKMTELSGGTFKLRY